MTRAPLSQLDDWELVNEDQDIRGWPVQDREGHQIGTVRELIVDTDTELVEVIVLEDGVEYPNDDIELGDRVVYLRGAELVQPVAEPVVEAVEAEATRIPRYEEELVAEKTAQQAGAVRISKDVTEEQQTLEVPVARGQVRVRRRVVDRPVRDTGEAFQDGGVLEVPVREEDVEVRKEPRVAEEFVISKEAVEDTERVTDTVRRERIDIDRTGDVEVEGRSELRE